jgi:hypothetical protein
MVLCECGCGQEAGTYANPKRRHVPKRFINGHNRRGKRFTREQCERVSEGLVLWHGRRATIE